MAERVLLHVEAIAGAFRVVTVIFLRVVEAFFAVEGMGFTSGPAEIRRIQSEDKSRAEDSLRNLLSRLKYEQAHIWAEVITGKAAESLIDFAAKNGVNLIIVATHGRSGVSHLVWGSTAERALRGSCAPALMVQAFGCIPNV